MKKLLAILALVTAPAFASDWVVVSESKRAVFAVAATSVKIGKNDNGDAMVYARVRVHNKESNRYEYEQNYVRLSHCSQGYGKLVTTSMEGRFLFENDFADEGPTSADAIATALCYVARKNNL
jgi:hypothetical protein